MSKQFPEAAEKIMNERFHKDSIICLATVDETGLVKGIAEGTTTVEIVAKGATLNTGAVVAVTTGA